MALIFLFIFNMNKTSKKENAFDMGIAGTAGAMDYSVGFGTPASPDISQSPAEFVNNKTIGSHSNTAAGVPAPGADNDKDIAQIYNKSDTPTPDEVIAGIKYELQGMIKKDKSVAKKTVLANLKKDPHYYGKLHMLNIDDKEMMKTTTPTSEEQMQERINILNKMLEAKGKKAETPQTIKDALKDTKTKKEQRYIR